MQQHDCRHVNANAANSSTHRERHAGQGLPGQPSAAPLAVLSIANKFKPLAHMWGLLRRIAGRLRHVQ